MSAVPAGATAAADDSRPWHIVRGDDGTLLGGAFGVPEDFATEAECNATRRRIAERAEAVGKSRGVSISPLAQTWYAAKCTTAPPAPD